MRGVLVLGTQSLVMHFKPTPGDRTEHQLFGGVGGEKKCLISIFNSLELNMGRGFYPKYYEILRTCHVGSEDEVVVVITLDYGVCDGGTWFST